MANGDEFLSELQQIRNSDDHLIVITLLLDIGRNLLQDKTNLRNNTLPIEYVHETFQSYPGAIKCLIDMGFEKNDRNYVLNKSSSMDRIRHIVQLLENEENKQLKNEKNVESIISCEQRCDNTDPSPTTCTIPQHVISISDIMIPNQLRFIPFLSMLNRVQSYENPKLKQLIRAVVPHQELDQNIKLKLKQLSNEEKVSYDDLLLLELLQWFKYKFFKWFDQPKCNMCEKQMVYSASVEPTVAELKHDAHNVELYKCTTCLNSLYRFPRYNDPFKLLETRCGRCGEYAIMFSAICRAYSYLTRHVYDTTDHVWTEIYSYEQKKWLHCDSCENLCDSPHVYEVGWKKTLTYIIAFSQDHVQDVTWRYVTNFLKTREQRKLCNEKTLRKTIEKINFKLKTNMNDGERKQLIKRSVEELASFLRESISNKESDFQGRQSGSLLWRISRRETELPSNSKCDYIYHITNDECEIGQCQFVYDSATDKYYRNQVFDCDNWLTRLSSCKNIQRKVEHDWNMCYIARKTNENMGIIQWNIQLPNEDYEIKNVHVKYPFTCFDSGKVQWQIEYFDNKKTAYSQDLPTNDSKNEYDLRIDSISCQNIRILATLSGGDGDCAWQKAQLFRQSTEVENKNDQRLFSVQIFIQKRSTAE